jgi:hypothetical protein
MSQNNSVIIQGVNPFFQSIFFVITVTVFLFFMYKSLDKINIRPSEIEVLKPFDYKNMIRYGDILNFIRIGFYIKDFTEFDMIQGIFNFSAVIWFEFDPDIVSLNTLNQFEFERGEVLERSVPYVRVIDGRLFARYNIRLRLTTNLNYKYFPRDQHRINIILVHNFLTIRETFFDSSVTDFIVIPRLTSFGWNKISQNVDSGFSWEELDLYDKRKTVIRPQIIFSLEYARTGLRYLVSIAFPLLLIFFLMLITFSLDPQRYATTIMSLSTAGITGLLAYRFVIDGLSPSVGYFMLSDYLFFLFLLVVFCIIVLNLFTFKMSVRNKKWAIIILHAIVLSASGYLFLIW